MEVQLLSDPPRVAWATLDARLCGDWHIIMNSVLKKQDDGTITITITLPLSEVKKVWEDVVAESVKSATLPGFRKGKAPKKLVEERIDQEKVQEEVLKKLLPEKYVKAIQELQIKPILNPKIHVSKLSNPKDPKAEDWEFTATTCETPEIHLNSYKDAVKKVTAKSKIILPGSPPEGQAQTPNFDEVVKALLENVTIKIPQILLDQEIDRLLSQTLDEIKRLGMNLDQYLSSTGRTTQSLREEYSKKAENDIKLEFTLSKIAEEEKITIDPKEVDEAIQKAKDDAERKNLEANKYLLASILRQQKTLDFIKNL